ncbi:hypothetical protein CI105_02500 [Candidatus Izimaplasma bacterium ZiA1]|uniref:ECF transporter S component n=1 Tax=Candidatus Izimoplasma sp. ZiA1 TaxID=2024899 RepID=UPI000BAA5E17|nr:hypothetical protein CI105_02500 [Candidatus Izimaplasma bacterium ZiA1]
MRDNKIKLITTIGILVALSVVFSFIKMPSPAGTVAFDAIPGFFAAVFLLPFIGGLIGAVGHIATAATAGFPFGLLSHFIIALTMFVACYLYGVLYKKNRYFAIVSGVMINVFLAILILGSVYDFSLFLPLIPFLLVGSTINVILATIIYESLKKVKW